MDLQYVHLIADEAALQSAMTLAASHFPPEHPCRNVGYLRWLYLQNPAGPATLVVALDGHHWVGMLALVPIELLHDGKPQAASFCVNVLSHPAYRGKNIFVNLIKLSRELLAARRTWLIGHPNTAAIPGWTRRKMQFRDPLRPSIPSVSISNWMRQTVRIRNRPDLLALPAELWNPKWPGVRIRLSPEFMAWRYLDHPCRIYDMRTVRTAFASQPIGLTVSRPFKPGVRLVVDWTHPGCKALPGRFPLQLVMAPRSGASSDAQALWQPTERKSMAFFVSTWDTELPNTAFHELTLGASDF